MTAKVYEKDGQLVIEDPIAEVVIRAVGKTNCLHTVEVHRDRVRHFVSRFAQRALRPADACLVIANVDTALGRIVADATMPGHDWQAYRDRGEIPFARGLATTPGMLALVEEVDAAAANAFRALIERDRLALVVFDHDVVAVFNATIEAAR